MWILETLPNRGDTSPEPRQGHSAVIYKDTLIIFGGRQRGNQRGRSYLNDLWEYNLQSCEWKSMDSAVGSPSPRHNHTAVVYEDSMYIYGGQDERGYCNNLIRFEFASSTFTSVNNPLEHNGRHSHTAVLYQNTMIVFGGRTQMHPATFDNNILVYHFDTGTWTALQKKIPLKPHGRSYHTAVVFEDKLLVHGGYFWDGNEQYFSDLWLFDLQELVWKEILPVGVVPHGRNRHKMVLYNEVEHQYQLFIFGGNFMDGRGDEFLNDAWILSIDTGGETHHYSWQNLSFDREIPCRGHHSMLLYKNSIVVMGGECQRIRFNDVFLFKPD